MTEEQPVTALIPLTDAELDWLCKAVTDDSVWVGPFITKEHMARIVLTLNREREAVADLRASLATEVRAEIDNAPGIDSPAGYEGSMIGRDYIEGRIVRLIEGDTDARER